MADGAERLANPHGRHWLLSLSYLRSFPFDKIKIDRSFVRDLSTKRDSSAIVHAITNLAQNLGMTTTAEGVETEEHLALLRAEGRTEKAILSARPSRPKRSRRCLPDTSKAGRSGWRQGS